MELISAIDWPHVILILVIIFLFVLRPELKNFIKRIKHVETKGINAELSLDQQRVEESNESTILDHIEIEKTQLLKEVEDILFEDLKRRNLDTKSHTTKILIRNLALEKIYHNHEQVYHSILGSQINLLKQLNQVLGTGRNQDFINNFFKNIQSIYPDDFEDWEIDSYLNFLISWGLITNENDVFHITHRGQDFLIWLVRMGKKEDKKY